jgi:hypothetical protein
MQPTSFNQHAVYYSFCKISTYMGPVNSRVNGELKSVR